MRPPVPPSTSARKQQRSIREFFASPPLVPLAKRFKAQSSAPPDSALKPQSASRPEHYAADASNITMDDTAAHTSGRHDPASQEASTASASHAEAPSCSGRYTADASDQAPRVPKTSDCDPLRNILTGTELASCQYFQQVASLTAVQTGSSKRAQSDVSVARHEDKTGGPGGRSDDCTDIDMEDKENMCSVIAAA